jgi:hypothetical protein
MKAKFWIYLVLIILAGFYFYLPVINFNFVDLPLLLIVCFFIVVFTQMRNINWKDIMNIKVQIVKKTQSLKFVGYAIAALLVYILFMQLILSPKVFRADSYQSLLGEVKEGGDFNTDITPIAVDKIRIVDKELANLLGDKVMGQQASLGSKSHIGEFTIQKIKNELYWVAPLLHSGFFKWLNNKDGTDGYVMVSATNERDIKLVQTINNAPVKVKYQPESFFNYDLQRHVYTHGNINYGLTDFSFELDDTGKPYWVITKYTNTIGFNGSDAIGTIIVDAQNGDITNYTLAETPAWVDRIHPSEFVNAQIDDWGELIKGYFNFSNEGKLKTTETPKLVYGQDNNSYWYTGLTSVGADESTVGFMLLNTRTKQATWYKQSGATEFAAQGSAMGKVQEKGYYASSAIPYNINGIPTYVMTLKDRSGLVKMNAMVAINDYTVVGVGNNLNEALVNYKSLYYQVNNKLKNTGTAALQKEISLVVSRFQADIKNGNTSYFFTAKDKENVFVATSTLSNYLPLTQIGDSIKISYDNDSIKIVDVLSFKNLNLEK